MLMVRDMLADGVHLDLVACRRVDGQEEASKYYGINAKLTIGDLCWTLT
jgi:hypothetical protein